MQMMSVMAAATVAGARPAAVFDGEALGGGLLGLLVVHRWRGLVGLGAAHFRGTRQGLPHSPRAMAGDILRGPEAP